MAAKKKRTPEYKAEMVALFRKSGKTAGEVSRDLDLTETSVRAWIRQAEIDAGIRDSDGIYGTAFNRRVEHLGIRQFLIGPRPLAERLRGATRRDAAA